MDLIQVPIALPRFRMKYGHSPAVGDPIAAFQIEDCPELGVFYVIEVVAMEIGLGDREMRGDRPYQILIGRVLDADLWLYDGEGSRDEDPRAVLEEVLEMELNGSDFFSHNVDEALPNFYVWQKVSSLLGV